MFGDFKSFCNRFNVDNTPMFVENYYERMFVGNAPTLAVMRATYGDDMTKAWVQLFLADVAESKGVYEKTDLSQIISLSNDIMVNYGYYKATEFMLFCSMFKSCRFRNERGEDMTKMYGEFQKSAVLDCLYRFKSFRMNEISSIEGRSKVEVTIQDINRFNKLLNEHRK